MSASYAQTFAATSQPRSGVFTVDAPTQALRFLQLGCEGGTYYATERQLTEQSAKAVIAWARVDSVAAVAAIIGALQPGGAPKPGPALFAAALLSAGRGGDAAKREMNFFLRAIPTASMLFTFVKNYRTLGGGWGNSVRVGLKKWYEVRSYDKLCYQMLKYQQRDGWSHRDLLRMIHPCPGQDSSLDELYGWATSTGLKDTPDHPLFQGYEACKLATRAESVAGLVAEFRLTREMIPSQWINEPEVALQLLKASPPTAMLRNLASFTRCGAITPRGSGRDIVVSRLTDPVYMASAGLHPVNVLQAWKVYGSGRGLKSESTWTPVKEVTDALEEAFYLSFAGLPRINRATIVGIDTSGSMYSPFSSAPSLRVDEAAAAMTMALVRASEPGCVACFGVSNSIQPLPISPTDKLHDVLNRTRTQGGGTTDLSAPTELARQLNKRLPASVQRPQGFLFITDNETNAHRVNPAESLRRYRAESGIQAPSVVYAMTASDVGISDPNDPLSLDIAGYDPNTSSIVQSFLG